VDRHFYAAKLNKSRDIFSGGLLAQYSGRVLTHKYILDEIWGTFSGDDTQSLRVFMANIRRKIEKDPAMPRYIFTEVGIGYRMSDE
jgi:two-component system KDP operon response regulator KdpE